MNRLGLLEPLVAAGAQEESCIRLPLDEVPRLVAVVMAVRMLRRGTGVCPICGGHFEHWSTCPITHLEEGLGSLPEVQP